MGSLLRLLNPSTRFRDCGLGLFVGAQIRVGPRYGDPPARAEHAASCLRYGSKGKHPNRLWDIVVDRFDAALHFGTSHARSPYLQSLARSFSTTSDADRCASTVRAIRSLASTAECRHAGEKGKTRMPHDAAAPVGERPTLSLAQSLAAFEIRSAR